MVPVRRHARHRSAYLAAGLTFVVLAVVSDANGQQHRQTEESPAASHADLSAASRPRTNVYQPTCNAPQTREDAEFCQGRKGLEAAKESADWTRGQAWAAIVGIVIISITLLFTKRAADTAFKAAGAARDAVTKADETLEHTRRTSERELRAYVFVHETEIETRKSKKKNPFVGSPTVTVRTPTGRVCYSYENTGKTPAKNVRVAARAAWITTGAALDITEVGPLRLIGPLGPKATFGDDLIPEGPTFPPSHVEGVANDGRHELHLWGRIEYDDAFSQERRWTTFHCYIGGAVGYDRSMHAVEPGNDYH